MAKFNTYLIRADTDDGVTIVDKNISALSLESAFHKAVEEAFDALEPGTGLRPSAIMVWRKSSPSEHQG